MNLTYLSELQEAYMSNLLIPVIGCGLSVPFQLPDWKTLIVEAADMFDLTDTDRQIMNQYLAVNNYLDAIDVLIDAGVTESQLQDFVSKRMIEAKKDVDVSSIDNNYVDLAKFYRSRFLTTNYDEFLNDFTGGTELPLETLGVMNVNEFSRERHAGSIIPLHGTVSRPESIVFSRKSYDTVYEQPSFGDDFHVLREGYTFLFMGFSFDDVYFTKLFDQLIVRHKARHYILFDRSQEKNTARLQELEQRYGVTAIFYDVTGNDHVTGIRDYLERMIEFADDDLAYVHKKKRVSAKREPHGLWLEIDRLERKAERYELTDTQAGYIELFHRADFEMLPITVQIAILQGLVFCHGAQKQFADAEQYVDMVLEKYEVSSAADSMILMLVQQLYDSFEWEKAFELIGKVRKKDRCLEFFRDLFEDQKQLIPQRPLPGEHVKVYGPTDLDEDEKAARRFLYKNLKNKYIAPDGISLTEPEQYADEFRKELVYYWLGAMAGQLFHQHLDAIVFLYQAYKMRPLAIYQEELGHNYHMIGIDQIRYRENSSAYELDRSSLMKAKRCFELVIHDTDENMRVSMIRSCGHDLLKILHILHFDFEFDRYYTDFSGYLEADHDLQYMKAEHDARYHLRLKRELLDHFDEADRIQIQAEYFYACAGSAAERGDRATSMQMSQKVISLLENREDLFTRTGLVLLLLDAAFDVKDLALHQKCRRMLEERGQSNLIVEARELELLEQLNEAEQKYMQAFLEHPDVSTVVIVKGFFIRNNLADRLFAFYEQIDDNYPELTEDDAGFYGSWIQLKIHYRKFNEAVALYARYADKFVSDMDRQEIEEMLRSMVLDFGDVDIRIEFLKGMLAHCPDNVRIQFVTNMLQLYMVNYRLDEAATLVRNYADIWEPGQREEWRRRIVMLRNPAVFGMHVFDRRTPVYSTPGCENKIRQARKSRQYCVQGMELTGREIIMPMWVLLALVYERREAELSGIKRIYISYAALFMLQDGITRVGDVLIWRVNKWLQNAGNVQFFAPKLTELAAELGDDIRVNLERAQICTYAKAHPELKVFMEELI